MKEVKCGSCGRWITNPTWADRYKDEDKAELCQDCYGKLEYDLKRLMALWVAETGQSERFISQAISEVAADLKEYHRF